MHTVLLTGCRRLTAIAVLLQQLQLVTIYSTVAVRFACLGAGPGVSDLDNASFLLHFVWCTTVQFEMKHFCLFADHGLS